ncbi:uncharacterized protein LOC128738631 [Sabethes cyaneus]|uniref:uncharacterized protein LOC128738631 n=1 Tax=Sabethes cyaneus TaxID=53552 RepID=UPI00237D61B6|nr:uncharacterized protein LOC128738631 [Sabethes cyaneus]
MTQNQLLVTAIVIISIIQITGIQCAPLGKSGGKTEFRDKAFDKEFKKVTWIGNEPVRALESFDNPPDRDNARREVDNFPSNIYSKYDNVQKKVKDWFDTEPLIDHIHESEKYGNEGDQFYFITKPLVQLTEKMSNLTNKILAAPRNLFRSANKSVSEKLNDFGGSLVGLRR